MITRSFNTTDIPCLERILKESFANEENVTINDFLNCTSLAIITDDSGQIISAGGCRPIIEAITITDKSKSVAMRRFALMRLFYILSNATQQSGYNQLHAFVQDATWVEHLTKVGFKDTVGRALIVDLERVANGQR